MKRSETEMLYIVHRIKEKKWNEGLHKGNDNNNRKIHTGRKNWYEKKNNRGYVGEEAFWHTWKNIITSNGFYDLKENIEGHIEKKTKENGFSWIAWTQG